MNFKKIDEPVMCDKNACKNKALFMLEINENSPLSKTYLCKSCLEELRDLINKTIAPKPINPPYKCNKKTTSRV